MRIRLAIAVVAVAAALAGCTSVLSGTGQLARGLAPGQPATPPTGCPNVVYPEAKLSFRCITTGLTASYTPNFPGQVWPLREFRVVERSTNWVLEEGAGHWGSTEGSSLEKIAVYIRQRMIGSGPDGGYGLDPGVDTVASRPIRVDGRQAYLLQTTFTINPQWAASAGTKVKQEKLWIVAIKVGADDVSLWYASVPDLTRALWPKVPGVIAAIKVG
jgi:hypothetical protein